MSDSWHAASRPGLWKSVCNFVSVLIDTKCCASKLAVTATGRENAQRFTITQALTIALNEMLDLLRAYQERIEAVLSSCMQSSLAGYLLLSAHSLFGSLLQEPHAACPYCTPSSPYCTPSNNTIEACSELHGT